MRFSLVTVPKKANSGNKIQLFHPRNELLQIQIELSLRGINLARRIRQKANGRNCVCADDIILHGRQSRSFDRKINILHFPAANKFEESNCYLLLGLI